jgi:peptidoglycan/LPS O-acetylase OafA/YrhL
MQERSFAKVFEPGANRFELLRHVFASMVLFDHAFVLSGVGHALKNTPFRFSFGHLGVACFFVLSGALIAASQERCGSVFEFLRNRALRIFPAYWTCLLVSALLIGPLNVALVAGPTFAALREYFWASHGPLGYVLKNSLLFQVQPGIGELFAGYPESRTINGSLWSIPWEAGCYLFVAALGSLRLMRHRALVLVCLVLAMANCWLFPAGSFAGRLYFDPSVPLLPVYFLLGMCFYLYRERIPRAEWLGAAAVAGFLAATFVSYALAAPFLAYAIFFASSFRVRASRERRPLLDLSYGLYIYGFPLQQTFVTIGLHRFGVVAMVAASALLVPWLALLSWRLIEAPALALKHYAAFTVARAPATGD